MNARTPIELENLTDKNNIVLFSEKGKIDFAEGCVNVGTYFDDPRNTWDEFFAPLRVFINRQKETNVIRIPVPAGAHRATIFLTSSSEKDDLSDINAMIA